MATQAATTATSVGANVNASNTSQSPSNSAVGFNGQDANTAQTPVTSTSSDQFNFTPILNPLNDFDQASYWIRFSLPEEGTNPQNEVVLAETGKTNIFIQDLRITSAIGTKDGSRNTIATTVVLKLVEPMGANLPDLMIAAANRLGISNYHKTQYKITIKFQGYNAITGAQNINILNRDYSWDVIITKFESKIDDQGSQHTLTFAILSEVAFFDQCVVLKNSFQIPISGQTTVGDILQSIIDKMNKDDKDSHGGTNFITYSISDLPYKTPVSGVVSPFKHVVNPVDQTKQDDRNSDWTHISNGTSFTDYMDLLFSASPTAREMARTVSTNNSNNQGTTDNVVRIFHRIESAVTYGPFNKTMNDYSKIIKYIIHPYETVRILSEIPPANADAKALLDKQKTDYIVNNKMISKVYDYIFTGQNTEVLKFDIEINTAWSVIAGPAMGQNSYTSGTVPKQVNPQALKQNTNDNSTYAATPTTPASGQANAVPTIPAPSEVRIPATTRSTMTAPTIVYADDIYNSGTSVDPLPVTYRQGPNPNYQVRPLITNSHTEERSAYGLLLNQLYEDTNFGSSLLRLTMTIRGDPYWLGSQTASSSGVTNGQGMTLGIPSSGSPTSGAAAPPAGTAITTPSSNASGNNVTPTTPTYDPQFLNSEYYLLLRFNLPQGYDETTGTVKLLPSELYSGFYSVITVEHIFSGGQFTQELSGTRLPASVSSNLLNLVYGGKITTTTNAPSTVTVTPTTPEPPSSNTGLG